MDAAPQLEKSPTERSALVSAAIVVFAILLGLCLRWAFREHTPPDTFRYLLPWYEFARAEGFPGLRQGFTNYAPFYTYLLVLIAKLDGLLPPLLLIKCISFAFEFGCAAVGYRLVSLAAPSPYRPALTFSAIWLAPSVLYNGALWGQAEAVWTFFIVLSVDLICRRRYNWAMVAFAVAVSVKLQAVILGPLIFALILQRRLHWLWLAAIPTVYVALALPTVFFGRPVGDVLSVYIGQAAHFRALSMGAPNLWLFAPSTLYVPGVVVGLTVAAVVGLAFSIAVARKEQWSPGFVILAATVILQLMPWVLPKMHDRFFFGFEMMAIVLAFTEPRLALVAVVAQIDAVLTYFSFDFRRGLYLLGTPLAAVLNTLTLGFMLVRFRSGTFQPMAFALSASATVLAYILWLLVSLLGLGPERAALWWPIMRSDIYGFAAFVVVLTLLGAGLVFGTWRSTRKGQ